MEHSPFPFHIDHLETPAILIDDDILQRNLVRMQQLANQHQISLRPHVKTHKSIQMAKRQIASGACGIAVAKLGEAEIMADGGLSDIQIANQVVGRDKIERLAALANRCAISCAVDSVANVGEMEDIFATHGLTASLLIEVDSGLHRAGLDNATDIHVLAHKIVESRHLHLLGLLTHAGHAYSANNQEQLKAIGTREGTMLVDIAAHLRKSGLEIPIVSVGSTPTAPYAAAVPGVTELRVGNYLFNDAIQVSLGVAHWHDCALRILTTITSEHADRFVIDSGSKVFSSDSGAHGSSRVSGFGQIAGTDISVTRLSEEHGVVVTSQAMPFGVGTRLQVIPNHACPVMNLADVAWLVHGGEVVDRLVVDARGKTS